MERGYTQFMNRFKSFDYMSYLMHARAHIHSAMKWIFLWIPRSSDHWRISMIVMQCAQAEKRQRMEEGEKKNISRKNRYTQCAHIHSTHLILWKYAATAITGLM